MLEEEPTEQLSFVDNKFDFDHFLQKIKCDFGNYQRFIIFLLCIPACFQSTYSLIDLVFIAYTPKHICKVNTSNRSFDNSSTIEINQCNYVSRTNTSENVSETFHHCNDWIYDKTYFDQTVVTQWDLVCDQAITIRTILTLFQLSYLMGIVYSYVQDRWGRKKAFLLNLSIYLLGSSSCLLSRNPLTFAMLKFIGSITGMWKISYCWALEFVGHSQRTKVSTILSVTYGVAAMSLAFVAYFCRTWIEFGMCTTFPFVLLYSYAFLIPESPRWLLANGKIEQFLETIDTMARWQKVKINLNEIQSQISRREMTTPRNENYPVLVLSVEIVDDFTMKKFFLNSNLRYKCLILTLVLIICNQLYFVVPFNMENFDANFYAAYLIQAAIETPATLLNLILLDRFGRIKPLSTFLFLSAFCCIMSWPSTYFGHWGPVIMAALARFFICVPVSIVEQLGAELFPTMYRGLRQGVTSSCLSLVSLSNQYIIYASHIWNILPLLIMGSLTLLASLLALFLPETKDLPLPDSVQQSELQGSVDVKNFKNNLRLNCL